MPRRLQRCPTRSAKRKTSRRSTRSDSFSYSTTLPRHGSSSSRLTTTSSTSPATACRMTITQRCRGCCWLARTNRHAACSRRRSRRCICRGLISSSWLRAAPAPVASAVGRGVLSLARPFIAAGVPTVVASLWDADDRASYSLFVAFHQAIRRGNSIVDAMREAQLHALGQSDAGLRDPANWGTLRRHRRRIRASYAPARQRQLGGETCRLTDVVSCGSA